MSPCEEAEILPLLYLKLLVQRMRSVTNILFVVLMFTFILLLIFRLVPRKQNGSSSDSLTEPFHRHTKPMTSIPDLEAANPNNHTDFYFLSVTYYPSSDVYARAICTSQIS